MSKFIPTTLQLDINIPDIFTLFYFEKEPGYLFPGEAHDFWELLYVDAGEVHLDFMNESKMLSQGDFILYPPNYFHHFHCGNLPSNLMVLSFNSPSEILHSIANRILHLNDHQTAFLSQILQEAPRAFSTPLSHFSAFELMRKSVHFFGSEQLIHHNLEMLFIDLIRNNLQVSQNDPKTLQRDEESNERVQSIIYFLKDNLQRKITIKDISAHLSLSPTCLRETFKQHMGITIMDYYTHLKITEAKRLIRMGIHTMAEIADALGYSSPQYFSRQFREETGFCAKEYAAMIQTKTS